MTLDLSLLNDNQRSAVEWDSGPLLILAGPGSGKTKVLTYRIAQLLDKSPGKTFKILGLTFTNKAATEMRERLKQLVPNTGGRTLLTTFHSFCADILRQHGSHVGLKPNFTILSQELDREAFLDEVIEEVSNEIGTKPFSSKQLLPMINCLLEFYIYPEKAEDFLISKQIKDAKVIASIYSAYRRKAISKNQLYFSTLIAETINLLENKPAICKLIQRTYTHTCVDEFQDTNLSQYRILKYLLKADSPNLFVVADDDQIIYQWNGASPERLEELRKDFMVSEIQLPENYRCPPEVIELANRLIVNNTGRSANKQELKAYKSQDERNPIRVKSFQDYNSEIRWVANDIANRPEVERTSCVILARTKKVLEQIISALEKEGLAGYLALRKNEFTSGPMQWLHAMLRLANSRQDIEQLSRLCKYFYKLEGININVQEVVSIALTKDNDYLRSWLELVTQRNSLSPEFKELIQPDIKRLVDRLEFWQLVEHSFNWFKTLESVGFDIQNTFDDFSVEKEVWENLVNDVTQRYGHDEVSLYLLLQELDMNSKTLPQPPDAIPCYTIHASKGMEFDHVYLISMVEDMLPSWAAIKKGNHSDDMQEERRNCFVAITRSQVSLTLTYSQNLFGYSKRPSRFLFEMGLIN
ncbi:ATP-dependent helicase [Nodularia sp. NIES-3585]|uniref:ATP-dependent helicase n=1 Tax=Nodularia sp. NIES-3585 TaxID=1973477 RepID=UPI000B5C280D|nr:ATP-dependent helicase [Nodularia sp. NIES-3585]GAX39030.1 ATP-dependent DNA helicase PcrA [Nodularia sp. NIES-3585]